LPIKQVGFDGKSIRTSLGITEFEKAKEIEKYNEQLVSAGIKPKSFQTDKMLWIPHHFTPCNLPVTSVTSNEKGFPIFGKYETTPILSDVLKGKILPGMEMMVSEMTKYYFAIEMKRSGAVKKSL
jgi:N-acetylmuramoyl-L-alanine amidase